LELSAFKASQLVSKEGAVRCSAALAQACAGKPSPKA
jgi:hypothetical protein